MAIVGWLIGAGFALLVLVGVVALAVKAFGGKSSTIKEVIDEMIPDEKQVSWGGEVDSRDVVFEHVRELAKVGLDAGKQKLVDDALAYLKDYAVVPESGVSK